jgi:alpha-tubulin suppressor-like RCC1 family protein
MPKGVAVDKNGRLFKTGDKVSGPYGEATVVQIEKAKVDVRRVWLYNKRKGRHQADTVEITVS